MSNAFAEAPPPKAPLYVTIDQQYHEWWKSKGRPAIPKDHVLRVRKALQGHPESSHLWAVLINKILVEKLKFKPTTHEPCFYSGTHKGNKLYFLRQVDDFAIACDNEAIAMDVINAINSHMTVQIKYLGLLTRFNGVDVEQTSEYIKIYNSTYIDKICKGHQSWISTHKCPTFPVPMKSESAYLRALETADLPQTDKEQYKVTKAAGINYRQIIGEMIYAMVTCRPDISFPLIKLSQYSANPAPVHFEAAKDIMRYLLCTKAEGIHFWRHQKRRDLPNPEDTFETEDTTVEARTQDNAYQLKTAVDADWGGNVAH